MKVGEKVVCVNNLPLAYYIGEDGITPFKLTINKPYKIKKKIKDLIEIKDDENVLGWLSNERFIPLREYNLEKLEDCLD